MTLLIVYGTKTGAARECAERLAKSFSNTTLWDIERGTPDIENFDTVVIGSGVRMGKIYKPVRNFIKNNLNRLLSKNTAVFLCNAYGDSTQKTVDKSIPLHLREHVLCIESFGGKPPFSQEADQEAWMKKEAMDAFSAKLSAYVK